jgi:hypothetical protein
VLFFKERLVAKLLFCWMVSVAVAVNSGGGSSSISNGGSSGISKQLLTVKT